MASLRNQVADYNAKFGKKIAKGKATQSYKGLGKSAAYRGASNKELRNSGDAAAANKAGEAAHKRHTQAKQRIADIESQFKNRRGKKAEAEKAAAIKEASAGLSPTKS